MTTPADRLAAHLRRSSGATVPVARRLLCEVLDALQDACAVRDVAEGRLAAAAEDAALSRHLCELRAGEVDVARHHLVASLRDREALARELESLARAVSDRAAALAAVTPERVRAYLAAAGWTRPEVLDVRGLRVERWRHPLCAAPDGALLVGPEAGDYLSRLWDVARVVGAVEGRHPTLVLAGWLMVGGEGGA